MRLLFLVSILGACEPAIEDSCDPTTEPVVVVEEVDCLDVEVSSRDELVGVAPVVICSHPRSGATGVDPNLDEIVVRFSRPMAPDRFSWVQVSSDSFPETTGSPAWLDDRTQRLPVVLEPGTTYEVWLNLGEFSAFAATDGARAASFPLAFQTAD